MPAGRARAALRRFLWQLGVCRSRFLVNESHGVSNLIVDVSQVHALARLIESESMADRYPGACWRYLFVGTPDVLEMMGNDVHQCELQRLVTPLLTELCTADAAFVGRTIDGVKDRDASKVSEPNRATVAVKLVERRVDYDFKVSRKGLHVRYRSFPRSLCARLHRARCRSCFACEGRQARLHFAKRRIGRGANRTTARRVWPYRAPSDDPSITWRLDGFATRSSSLAQADHSSPANLRPIAATVG
jgi:hypothetical protein